MPARFRRDASFLALALVGVLAFGGARLSASLTRPSPYLTRAEAAAIILLSRPQDVPAAPDLHPYADVYADDWFAPTVLAAAEMEMLSPDVSGTKLKPFGSVNRASFLKMLAIAFDLPLNRPHAFADVSPFSWYAPYAGIETDYLLFRHTHPTALEPDRLLTQDEARAALETFLARRTRETDDEARRLAAAQADGDVQLYGVISTKLLRVVFVSGDPARIAAPAHAAVPRSAAPRASSARATPSGSVPAARKTTDEIRAEILALVNAARSDAGLAPLVRSEPLERSAQRYAEGMVAEGFFGHTDPRGGTLQDRAEAAGYFDRSLSADCACVKGYVLGENLARGQRSAREVVDAWMESPSHRGAILGKDFTDLGVGLSAGMWVQHFGGVVEPGA